MAYSAVSLALAVPGIAFLAHDSPANWRSIARVSGPVVGVGAVSAIAGLAVRILAPLANPAADLWRRLSLQLAHMLSADLCCYFLTRHSMECGGASRALRRDRVARLICGRQSNDSELVAVDSRFLRCDRIRQSPKIRGREPSHGDPWTTRLAEGGRSLQFEVAGKRIVYCYIRKNACTTFKNLILERSDFRDRRSQFSREIDFSRPLPPSGGQRHLVSGSRDIRISRTDRTGRFLVQTQIHIGDWQCRCLCQLQKADRG